MIKITPQQIKQYRTYLIAEEKSAATLEKYIRDVKAFAAFTNGAEIDKTTVLEYKAQLQSRYAPASVNAALSSLNSFFTFSRWYDLRVKTLKIQRQLFTREEKELTKAEYNRLLAAAKEKGNEKLYMLMQTICACGIRVSELRYITVESLRTQKAVINLKGKMRIVMLPTDLCKMLSSYVKAQKIETGCIFVSRSGKPLDRSNIWKLMKSLCGRAGVAKEKVFPHNLRHLFARTFYALQKDIVRLADILGHTSINTTRIYTMEAV